MKDLNIQHDIDARLQVYKLVRRFVAGCQHKADCVYHGVVIPDECQDCEVFKSGVVCTWTANEDGVYETTCGNLFELYADGPREIGFKFCPYCGNSVNEQ